MPEWTHALHDAYIDFTLSRQAMNCTAVTMSFYKYTAGKFVSWIETQGICRPDEITARHVRQFIAELTSRGFQDTTVHDYARAIRTLLRFWHTEGYMPAVKFDMPKLTKKRLPVLTAEQLQTVLKACSVRDKALVLFMVDSGLRRAETIRLNWGDIDLQTGLVKVRQGKGGKDRSAVIGAKTRRALLKYRRMANCAIHAPLFQTRDGDRFTHSGFVRIFQRLTRRTGVHITAHSCRRSFCILALRAGMNVLYLQALGGWSSLDMVYHYAGLVDSDLLQAHQEHSPIDNL